MVEFSRNETSMSTSVYDMLSLATRLPKIGETRPGGQTFEDHYRDNFFKRFPEMRAVIESLATESEVFYVRMVKERFGLDLLAFYREQKELCDAICDALAAKAPYDQLVSGYQDILEQETRGIVSIGTAESVQQATGHPLGIEAIGMYY